MNLKYLIGALISLPLLPLMYVQGKKIRSVVPRLPEAKGTTGIAPTPASSAKKLNLLTIGESTIAGVGVSTHEEGFSGTLARTLAEKLQINVHWRVYAKSGYTARRVVQDLLPTIAEEQAGLIVIGLGANDAFTLNNPNNWKSAIRMLIEALQAQHPNAVLVFCNMPPIKEFPAFTPLIKFTVGNLIELLGQELASVVKEYKNVHYFGEIIKINAWAKKLQIEANYTAFFSDGVHPSKLTYQLWAKDVAHNIVNQEQIRNALTKAG